MSTNDNELAARLKHEGIRAGEIIAYRAWRAIDPGWFRNGDARLYSVFMRDSSDPPPDFAPLLTGLLWV